MPGMTWEQIFPKKIQFGKKDFGMKSPAFISVVQLIYKYM